MLRRMLPILCAALSTTVLALPLANASAAPAATATSRYLVTLRPGASAITEARDANAKGWEVRKVYRKALNGMAVDLTPAEAAALAADPQVASIELDRTMRASADQGGAPWGLDRIDQRALPLNGVYSHDPNGGRGVKVYVVDTGVRSTHAQIAGRVDPGVTYIEDGMGTEDCQGHGTHVASTIAGTTYGVAKAARIVPIRVLDCLGSGSVSAIVAGLDWILTFNNGAPAVVNMSLGGAPSSVVDAAVQRLIADGITVVVAAGNSAFDACLQSPARVAAAITVGATQSDDARAQYSNFGPCLDIWAPGTSVLAAGITSDTATATKSGTSMASPHVAGAAALLKGVTPAMSPATVASTLASNATSGVVTDTQTGSPNRLLNVGGTAQTSPPPPPPSSTPTVGTTSLAAGRVGTAYSQTLTASGGTTPYSWSVAAGALPAGLTLNATTGTISGTPTTAATASFTVRVTDATGASATKALSITVSAATASLPGAFGKSSPTSGAKDRSRTSLTLTWAASSGATRYEVCWDTSGNSTCNATWVSTGTARSYTLTGLSSRTTYYWQVRAVNGAGVTSANSGSWWRFTTR